LKDGGRISAKQQILHEVGHRDIAIIEGGIGKGFEIAFAADFFNSVIFDELFEPLSAKRDRQRAAFYPGNAPAVIADIEANQALQIVQTGQLIGKISTAGFSVFWRRKANRERIFFNWAT